MATYTIEDPVRGRPPIEVAGQRVADVSTQVPGLDRWNTLELFELEESGEWLLYRVGRSRRYHAADTACSVRRGRHQAGEECGVDDLPDGARPCPDCRPLSLRELEDLADDGDPEPVRFEFPRPSINRCKDPAAVVERLESTWSRDTGTAVRTMKLSRPAAELIRQAMENSPRFTAGLAGVTLPDEAAPAPRRIA